MARRNVQRSTGIHVEGLRSLQVTLTKMGKSASDEVRDASTGIADDLLNYVRMGARTEAEKVAASYLRTYRDRIPKAGFASERKVPVSGEPTIAEFFYGVEFGGPAMFPARIGGHRFRDHTGTEGYFFYPALRKHGPRLADAWFDSIETVMEKDWNAGVSRALVRGAP